MFTGIVAAVGEIETIASDQTGARMCVQAGGLDLSDVRTGDSICVNGACLTVVGLQGGRFQADLSPETLRTTTLGGLGAGARVNLEKAMTLATPLGGHLVSGHVDGIGEVVSRVEDGQCQRLTVTAPKDLQKYICRKGSICVDGVSLTVNARSGPDFTLQIIPHTSKNTMMDGYRAGQLVNIEVDIVARYLERLMSAGDCTPRAGLTAEFLAQCGFDEAGPNDGG